ncbi:MAG: ATP-binding protein [Planctomycetota bacterium]
MRFRIPAVYGQMSALRSRLRRFLSLLEPVLDEMALEEIVLAVDEAATNIVKHSYGNSEGVIDAEYEIDGTEIIIRLWDDGIGNQMIQADSMNPTEGTQTEDALENGRGLFIMQATMSKLEFLRTETGRNLLIMRRFLVAE